MNSYKGTRPALRAELRRILELIARGIAAQRARGGAPSADALRGVVIEEEDAAGLVEELVAHLAHDGAPPAVPPAPSATDDAALARASEVFGLDALGFDALILALAVELDARFATLVAYLNDHIARTRPTVGLLLALTDARVDAVEFSRSAAVRHRLLLLDGDGPLSSVAFRVAPELLQRLADPTALVRMPAGVRLRPHDGPALSELLVAGSGLACLSAWANALREGALSQPLVVSGPPGSGRATAVQAAAASVGRTVVEAPWSAEVPDSAERLAIATREALWHDAVLLLRVPAAAREADMAALWFTLADWNVPVAFAVPAEITEPLCAAAPVEPRVLHVDGITMAQRERLWRRLLPDARMSDAERVELAARYDFLPGLVARAARRARAEDAAGTPDFDAVSRVCRAVGSARMGPIAQRMAQPYTRSDLVLPQDLLSELDLASAWMRNRARVFEEWGFARRISLGLGLTALFTGEPGTGKTMAAQVLARELGLELFRVDLSRVMSKYIGETEKNLSQLFDDVRASGAILFFDEADALFGKRTEVKDAHDRYANLEIGYLLQRMEEHTGTTILATNRRGDLDDAFTRRFHFILNFPMPREPERRRIWEGMLPAEAEREPELELDMLARDYEIAGGSIRNSVLSAAFIAANEGVPIGPRQLKRGLRRELLKAGRVLDSKQRRLLEGD